MSIGTKIMSLWCLETEILAEITFELAAILKMAAILKLFLANVILVFSAQKTIYVPNLMLVSKKLMNFYKPKESIQRCNILYHIGLKSMILGLYVSAPIKS